MRISVGEREKPDVQAKKPAAMEPHFSQSAAMPSLAFPGCDIIGVSHQDS